ncbi:MAG: mandelate racemase/muconate lactonizing enzyme family protein [Trueperaceae bacterium]
MAPLDHFVEAPVSVPRAANTAGLIFAGYRCLLVRIDTDDGLTGIGEGLVRLAPRATAAIVEALKPLLVGRDPAEVDVIWEDLYATMVNRGHTKGFMLEAISAIDIALWDVLGQHRGEPLHRLLGGSHHATIPCYASSVRIKPPDQAARDAEELVADGFTALKLKVGRGAGRLREDLEAVAAVRDAIGPHVELMVDANGGYDLATARTVAHELARHRVAWFEEPLPSDDLRGYAALRRVSSVPIAAGETWFTRVDFREALLHEAVDIVQPDVSRCGGISEARKIAQLASAFHLAYAPHTGQSSAVCLATSMHLAAAAPNTLTYEFIASDWSKTAANPLRTRLTDFDFEASREGARVRPPNRPGIGLRVDWDAVAEYTSPD